jgi:hypothetical protein
MNELLTFPIEKPATAGIVAAKNVEVRCDRFGRSTSSTSKKLNVLKGSGIHQDEKLVASGKSTTQ